MMEIYGTQVRVKVTGMITFQIPNGFPERTDDEVTHKIRLKMEMKYFDDFKMEVIERLVNTQLIPDDGTLAVIHEASRNQPEIPFGKKIEVKGDGSNNTGKMGA